MAQAVKLLFFALLALVAVSHIGLVVHLLVATVRVAIALLGYAVMAGAVWCGLSAVWRWLTTPVPARARPAAPVEAARPRLQIIPLPRRPGAGGPETCKSGRGKLVVIGPGLGKLAERVDPVTRTAFAHGEHAVQCGACGRLYKLDTCRALQYCCPVDQASLRARAL